MDTLCKTCPSCGKEKSLDEYPKNKNTSLGVATYCKPCHNKKGRESVRRLHGSGRHYHLMRRYGLSDLEVSEMARKQGGKCLICGSGLSRPHVDHDHATGEVRGILCSNCNGGLGNFKDDIGTLEAAIRYLRGGQ